jgi:hypothetical protein
MRSRESLSASTRSAATEALASAFIPGVGQLLQGRPGAAVIHFGVVICYLVIGARVGLRYAFLSAFVWNCYSVIDAYRHRAD